MFRISEGGGRHREKKEQEEEGNVGIVTERL